MNWTCITGAAQGLGRAIALLLAERGHNLVLHYRSQADAAEQLAKACRKKGVEAYSLQGDFSTSSEVTLFLDRYRSLAAFEETQYLVNNVGNCLRKSALETSDEEWKSLFQNNFHVPCQLMRALSPSLKATRGAVVNIGYAGVSQQVLSSHFAAYHAAKMALWTVTKSLAGEWAPYGVRINMISPGYLENSRFLVDAKQLPMGRLGTLEETARVVAFLLDPAQSYVTGQNIDVAGGVRL